MSLGQRPTIPDLSQITQVGYYTVPVDIKSPSGVSILEQDPTTVDIHVDTWKSAEKEVIVMRNGTPKSGFGVTHLSDYPETLTVEAPSLILDKIAYLAISVDLDNADRTFSSTLPIEAYDDMGTKLAMDHIHLPQQNVSLEIGIGKVKTIPVSPTITGVDFNTYSSSFSAQPTVVTVTASDEILNVLTSINSHPISLPNQAGQHSVDALLNLPANVFLTEDQPNTVHFDITITEKESAYGT